MRSPLFVDIGAGEGVGEVVGCALLHHDYHDNDNDDNDGNYDNDDNNDNDDNDDNDDDDPIYDSDDLYHLVSRHSHRSVSLVVPSSSPDVIFVTS